jgi:uncharacterized membrane protein/mono/diheme cytochrome c family protein
MITDIIGRLHPLVVHLPIGIFLLAFTVRYLSPRKIREQDAWVSFMLAAVAISSLCASLFGWMLSLSGEYEEDAVFLHQWSAILFTVIVAVLLFLHTRHRISTLAAKAYHGCFWLAMILLGVAGHHGGSLTHGEGYLNFSASTDDAIGIKKPGIIEPIPAITDTSTITVYAGLLEPVFEAKCVQCHNVKKTKGGYRMDEIERLLKGGKTGAAIMPGDASVSELFKRISLPGGDEKHMPPKGKKQLTPQETALIHWWIQHGASGGEKIRDHAGNDTVRPFISGERPQMPVTDPLPDVGIPDSSAMIALRNAGFVVRPVSIGSHMLEVSAVNFKTIGDDDLKLIAPVAKNILWLSLSERALTDRVMAYISPCVNLRRLDLRKTAVTDAAVKEMVKLGALEYLNLVGTGLTDAGLLMAGEIPSLEHIYCWDTKVTKEGADKCSKMHPDVSIDLGVK